MVATPARNGSIEILNTGFGDTRIEFQEREGQEPDDKRTVVMEEAAAAMLLRDLQRRGYAILVQLEGGLWARAIDIDLASQSYRVPIPAAPASDIEAQELAPVLVARKANGPERFRLKVDADQIDISQPFTDEQAKALAEELGIAQASLSLYLGKLRRERGVTIPGSRRGPRVRDHVASIPIGDSQATAIARSAGG